MSDKRPRYFEKPENDKRPMGFWRVVLIVVSSHLGVRKRSDRHDDFTRADGRHVFAVAVIYFVLVLLLLVVLVNWLASHR